MSLPAFCRVEGTARPTTDSDIRFEVWIPPVDAWNGKFQGVGNGGYQGSISYTAMATALRRGYATASTDTGHTGDDMKFGVGHPEKLIDYGHRAIHVMTDASKLIIRNAAGRFAERSYFVGCSAGGQQALSEAQRYPEDYDGIVAGDPANNRIRQTFGFLSSWMATHAADGKPLFTQPKLALLTKSVVDACDALDGLKDGIIDDPRRCHFDPAKLLCKSGTDDATCLTAPQVDAAKKMYDGAKNPRTGEAIFTGWPRGSEGFGESAGQSWRQVRRRSAGEAQYVTGTRAAAKHWRARAAAPRPRRRVARRARTRTGSTRVSFTTSRSPGDSSWNRSRNSRWRTAPPARS